MIEVWCEGCREWYPLSSVHGWQFPRRGSTRFPRRVRWTRDPGPKPEWAEGNPLVNVRTCVLCGKRWWEHDHSVATLVQHLHERHPGWDRPQPRLQPTPG